MTEFNVPKAEDPNQDKYQFQWLYTNGLLGVIFSFGLLYTALKSRKARSWLYGTGWFRSFIADYGVPFMVVVWSALSFSIPSNVPSGVPRRLFSPLPWESDSIYHWTVIKVEFFLFPFSLLKSNNVFKELENLSNNTAGYGESSCNIHFCCNYSSLDDSRTLFL